MITRPHLCLGILAILLLAAGCVKEEPPPQFTGWRRHPQRQGEAPAAPGVARPEEDASAEPEDASRHGIPWPLSMLLSLVFVGCIAALHAEGIWSNAIQLVNVVTAGLLAMNFFEPAARLLTRWQPGLTTVWDFLALWCLFAIFLFVGRELTRRASRAEVRFSKEVEKFVAPALAAVIGWVTVGFLLASLHTAPLGASFLFGNFRAGEKMFFGLAAPDLQWLAFTRHMSEGAYSPRTARGSGEKPTFDPQQFVDQHTERRQHLETYLTRGGSLMIESSLIRASEPPEDRRPDAR